MAASIACVLGRRDARRRLPRRPCERAVARRGRRAARACARYLRPSSSRPSSADVHLIAEAWDAGGPLSGRLVSRISLGRMERPLPRLRAPLPARRAGGLLGEVATRIAGSSDLYAWARQDAEERHQLRHLPRRLHALRPRELRPQAQRGERRAQSRRPRRQLTAGTPASRVPTDDPDIHRLRAQRARNFVALLMLSQGVPMLHAGDEVLRTQRGNNNAYCQDNRLQLARLVVRAGRAAMLRFTRELIALRKRHPSLRRTRFFDACRAACADIRWYGETPRAAGLARSGRPRAVLHACGRERRRAGAARLDQHVARPAKTLPLPRIAPREWRRIADTTLVAPDDIVPAGVQCAARSYRLRAARHRDLRGRCCGSSDCHETSAARGARAAVGSGRSANGVGRLRPAARRVVRRDSDGYARRTDERTRQLIGRLASSRRTTRSRKAAMGLDWSIERQQRRPRERARRTSIRSSRSATSCRLLDRHCPSNKAISPDQVKSALGVEIRSLSHAKQAGVSGNEASRNARRPVTPGSSTS